MRRLSQLLLLNCALAFIAQTAFADGFNSVYTKDGVNIIAVGNAGNVFRSSNGGASFGTNPLGATDLKGVFAINSKVWITTINGVYVSTDAGSSFNLMNVPGNTYNSACFVDDNNGWICGTGGYIGKSTNGGTSFSPQTSGTGQQLNMIRFINATTGVACGNNGAVVMTTNGGTSWSVLTTGTTRNLLSIDYKGAVIIAASEYGQILKSTNNGTSFTISNYNIASKSDVRGVSMVNASTFYVCGGGGFIRRSDDAGATYAFQSNPMMAPLSSIYFYDANNGWAVSSTVNAIVSTHNGGTTWAFQQGVSVSFSWTQKQPGSSNIGNGFSPHPTNRDGMFIMMGNNLYKSLNRGETWTQIGTCSIGGSAHTLFVSPLDTNIMLCSKGSSGGYVCRTTNSGVNWTSVYGPGSLTSYGMPLEIDENNPSTYYLAPDNGVIMRSTDNGLTFSNWGTHVFRSPCDISVAFQNSNNILIGDGITSSGTAEFWKSTDNGVNWTLIHGVSGSEIPMIASTNLDPALYYHTTWSSGGFWKSTNTGTAFTLTTGPAASLWATDISKDDPTAVAYDTYGSTCYLTTDGGNNFITTNVGSTPAAGIYYYDKATLLIQHGGGVYKLNINYSVLTANSQISSEIPKEFSLMQNYPNPFNPSTKIEYNINKASFVSIKVYDATGSLVSDMVNTNLTPGKYSVDFDASNFATGVYFYSLFDNGNKIDTKKMILVK